MELDSKIMEKAATLIEALPYIQRFNRKIIVVKYGGSAMADEELKRNVIKDVVLLKLVGFKPIIVHGGGKEISRWVSKVGMEPRFVNGLRVTDADTMEIAEMVLNKVNKSLVSMVNELGVKAVGISGKDGQLLRCNKKLSNGQDIGFVGDIKEVNPKILFDLLEKDFLPIICPIGFDDNCQSYNINADTVAAAVAASVEAENLILLTDVEGIKDKDGNVIAEIHKNEIYEMIHDGSISGGMIPKVLGCLESIDGGVTGAHIIDGRIPHCLLLEIFTKTGIGTLIKSDKY